MAKPRDLESGPDLTPSGQVFDVPISQAAAYELGAEELAFALKESPAEMPKLLKRYLAWMYFAQFTLFIAFVAPGAYSLAVRVAQIAPEIKDAVLPLAIGIPATLAVIGMPLVGVLSDATRSRLGRRRPWFIGGAVAGLAGSTVIGLTDTVPLLVIGWSVAYLGYSVCASMLTTHLGDKLPEDQRGKVAGIGGAITQLAPLFGVAIGGALAGSGGGLFIAPAILAFIGGIIFGIVMQDAAYTGPRLSGSRSRILSGFGFNPRRYPNLAWVWISRAFVFLALAFSGLYGVYLLTSRLGLDAGQVAALVTLSGIGSIAFGIGGALLSGFLSDKFKTRKPFLVVSALLIACGLISTGLTTTTTQYVISGFVVVFGIGIYGAVDQALYLDVLPREEDQNGRFLAIITLGSAVPQAVGPLLAGGTLALFGGGYTAVYMVGALFAVIGALCIIPISVGKRATLETTSIQIPQ
jgi:MFS family permease